jgi:hypothetical protein
MVAMTAPFKRFQQMRHMREKKEGFRRGLATLMRLRQAPEERNVLRVALPKQRSSVPWALILTGGFMADNSMTGAYQLNLPKDLLTEAKRQQPKLSKEQLKVEGWRTSWLSRISEILVGKD